MSNSPMKLSGNNRGKDGAPSNSLPSISAVGYATPIKRVIDRPSGSEQDLYCPPTNSYDYYYPGYNGAFTQSDDKSYFNTATGSYMSVQSDNPSLLYYVPGYGPYPTGFMGVDGKQPYASSEYLQQPCGFMSVDGKQPYVSSEHLQQPCSYGSEAFPFYSYNSSYTGNGSAGTTVKSSFMKSVMGPSTVKSSFMKSVMGPSGSGKSIGFNAAKINNSISSKTLAFPFNSKVQHSASNFAKSVNQNQPLNKLDFSSQSADLVRGFYPAGKLSSSMDRNPGIYMHSGPVNYRSNFGVGNNNQRSKSRENFGQSGEIESLAELTCGPRADNRNNTTKLPAEVEQPRLTVETDKYNLQEFQTQYDNAKFFVIKSYSEDDIHKCIKYDVWSSTPNGNKKLDAAFQEARAKTSEIGTKCPVFLFFSVNGSGQFVGIAEMMGQVEFSKNMEFWQLDKWNGFFPIKWHVIKDVPNTLLRHIILENNDNRPVTFSRDTQEIGLKEGLEMLSIFKNYSEKMSVLDDFNFYENREKSLKAKRNPKPTSQTNWAVKNGDYEKKHIDAGEGIIRAQSGMNNQSDQSSLISLTKNLSVSSQLSNNCI